MKTEKTPLLGLSESDLAHAIAAVAPEPYRARQVMGWIHDKRVSVEHIVRVMTCVAEDASIRGTALVREVEPNTVLQ